MSPFEIPSSGCLIGCLPVPPVSLKKWTKMSSHLSQSLRIAAPASPSAKGDEELLLFCFVFVFLKKEGSICVSACLPLPFQQPLQGDSQISFLPPENLIDPLRIHLSPLSLLPALLSCSHLFLLTHNPKHQQDIEV